MFNISSGVISGISLPILNTKSGPHGGVPRRRTSISRDSVCESRFRDCSLGTSCDSSLFLHITAGIRPLPVPAVRTDYCDKNGVYISSYSLKILIGDGWKMTIFEFIVPLTN
jgi:hypothetical protein